MRIGLKYKRKKFSLDVVKCNGIRKGIGLMFKTKKNSKALLFNFNKKTNTPLTSLFVFFPFLVLWLDQNNNILEFRVAKPFEFVISSKNLFNKVVEIPIKNEYQKVIDLVVGKGKV